VSPSETTHGDDMLRRREFVSALQTDGAASIAPFTIS
jgi:hypothetical protein